MSYCTGYGVPHRKPANGFLVCGHCRWNPNPSYRKDAPVRTRVIRYELGSVSLPENEHYSDAHQSLGKFISFKLV